MKLSIAFYNLVQAMTENRAAVANLTTSNSTLAEKLAMYTNHLSTKEANSMALQTAIQNLQREVKKLKAGLSSLERSVHSGCDGADNKDNGRMTPK